MKKLSIFLNESLVFESDEMTKEEAMAEINKRKKEIDKLAIKVKDYTKLMKSLEPKSKDKKKHRVLFGDMILHYGTITSGMVRIKLGKVSFYDTELGFVTRGIDELNEVFLKIDEYKKEYE